MNGTTTNASEPAGEIELGARGATAAQVIAVARHQAPVRLSSSALAAMAESRRFVDSLAASSVPVYGIRPASGRSPPATLVRTEGLSFNRAC